MEDAVRDGARCIGKARVAVGVAFFVNGAVVANWVPRIPAIKAELGLDSGSLGLALLGFSGGAVVSLQLVGHVIARVGSDRATRAGGALLAAALVLPSLAPSAIALALALFALGAAAGAMDVAMNTNGVVVERACGRSIMASLHGLFSLGGIAGAAIGGLAAGLDVAPWAHFAVAGALLGLGLLVAGRWLMPDRHRAAGAGEAETDRERGGRPPFSGRAVLLGVVAFCVLVGEGSAADWSSVYLREDLQVSAGFAGAGFAAFSAAMAAVRLAGDRLIDRLGPVATVRWGGAVGGTGLGLALLVDRPAAGVAGFGLLGAGLAPIVPVVFSAAGRSEPAAGGHAIARVAALGYLGSFVGPPLIGMIAVPAGLPLALAVPAALAVVAATCGRAVAPAAAGRGGQVRIRQAHPRC